MTLWEILLSTEQNVSFLKESHFFSRSIDVSHVNNDRKERSRYQITKKIYIFHIDL